MPTTYTNGLKLPDLGSIDWFNAYKNNIDILDPIVGTVNGVATTYAPISHNHDASEITSGTIDIARLPPAALERLTTVADQTARYALTTSTVQLGDTVKQLDTGIMYLVVDTTKLNSADGYVEYSAGTASKAIADEDGTSIKTGYVNVAGDQTVSGDKSFTGSNTFNNILPNATNTYSLGSSSYQWSSVYAQTYYYNGTAWGLDKENVWSSLNVFQKGIYLAGDRRAYVCPMWDGAQSGLALLTQNKNVFIGNYTDDASGRKVLDTTKSNIKIFAGESNSETTAIIEPANTVNSQLGTSTNKWKTLNGINPGALGMPVREYNDSIALDTTDWVYDGTVFSTLITMPGWVVILAEGVDVSDFIKVRLTSYTRSPGLDFAPVNVSGSYSIKACFPIHSYMWLCLKLTNGASSMKYARYYPCLGNV